MDILMKTPILIIVQPVIMKYVELVQEPMIHVIFHAMIVVLLVIQQEIVHHVHLENLHTQMEHVILVIIHNVLPVTIQTLTV